jgi:hypothetical protein
MKSFLTVFFVFITLFSFSQELSEVEAGGIGINKSDALNDALRNAVGQAAGVALKSETRVENYMIVSDAIATNINGYVSGYQVISEIPFPDRFEVKVKAKISTSPMKADFQLLSKSIGGVRFLVMPDPKHYKDKNAGDYDYAVQKINSYLAEKKYRYIEKSRFESLRKEAMNMMQESDTGITYVQQLGILADAQFLIVVSDINTSTVMGAFDIPRGTKVNLVAKAYDNCTGEGLGTIILESNSKPSVEQGAGFRSAIDEAVNNGFDKLLLTFTEYIGSWINNGTPFELRFYNTGTYRDFRDLRNTLKNDNNFGGDMEVTSVYNYTKLNCTFRNKADDLADKLLDIADAIPNMAAKRLDVKMIYGRQISFAPQNYIIPNMVKPQSEAAAAEPAKPATATPAKTTTATPPSKPSGSSTGNTPAKSNTNPSTVKPATNNNKVVTPSNDTKPKQ